MIAPPFRQLYGFLFAAILPCVAALGSADAAIQDADFQDFDNVFQRVGEQLPGRGELDLTTPDMEQVRIGAPFDAAVRGDYEDIGGFIPGVDIAISGVFHAWLRDDERRDTYEYARVVLDGMRVGQVFEVDIDLFSEELSGELLASVNADGKLNWKIGVKRGSGVRDFWIEAVALQVETMHSPEPSSFLIWVTAVCGVTLAVRKRRQAQ